MLMKNINELSEKFGWIIEVYDENAFQYQYWTGPNTRSFTENKFDWVELSDEEYKEYYSNY